MQNADWAFAAGALDPKDGDDLRLWQEGRHPERLVIFVRLRTTDAQHARELLEASLGELPAKERVDFVAALEPDLGADDTRILELLLKDRSRDVRFIALLALSDEGRPSYDKDLAAKLAALGVPSFACTPDMFPALMAAAIRRDDINQWAASQGLVASRVQA